MDARRKRLLYRFQHCGMKENDILLGGFAERHIDSLDDDEVASFEALLDETDNDLYNWFTGREPLPARIDNALTRKIVEDCARH